MEDSFGKRYFFKLISTVLICGINAVVQIILPTALGVEAFGFYTYNLNVFTSVLSIAILSMDGAFASKISKRKNELGMIGFYGKFLLIVAVVLNIMFIVAYAVGLFPSFFRDQYFGTVILALNAYLSLKIIQEVSSLFDCYAETKISEPFMVIQKLASAILVFGFYYMLILDINMYYIVQIIVALVVASILLAIFFRKNKDIFCVNLEKTAIYSKEFYNFCKPLVLANIISNLIIILSNWLLEKYGGNAETAYYGVAWQLNSLVVYTFTPIIALLQREYSIRVKDMKSLGDFYRKILRVTIFIDCFFSCFILINTDTVLLSLYGNDYMPALVVTKLIMAYTIFQVWGQVNGAFFTATERTKLYAKIIVFDELISFISILIFQIPNFIFPEGLGSIGIGIQKTVVVFISVMVLGLFNCKYLGISYMSEYKVPFLYTGIFCVFAFISRSISSEFAKLLSVEGVFAKFIVMGIIYSAICLLVFILVPNIFGINKESILSVFSKEKNNSSM